MASAFPVNGRNRPIFTMAQNSLAAIATSFAIAALAWAQDSGVEAAKQVFAQYVALEQAYDPSIADLYADDALIKTRRRAPMGEAREMIVPAPKYKTMLRELAPVAKARSDRSTYKDVTYTSEGALVRINGWRFFGSKKAPSAISLLVGRSPGGQWLIYEEVSESQE
jgi:hypothetical protein